MKGQHKHLLKVTMAMGGLLLLHPTYGQVAFAQQPDPRSIVGEVSPLIPMQSAEAVHMGLVWKKKSPTPKILFHSRFPEYTPNDVADPVVIDAARHLDAFRTNAKFHTALLDEADFALNRAAFKEVGFSKGNFYNTYCNARVTLADGRVYVFGGHDMQSQNGLFTVNIFDPETETWVPRVETVILNSPLTTIIRNRLRRK